jgi:hypothetical protein
MKGFKVVYNVGDRLVSLSCPQEGEVQYSPDRWTKPKKNCGPLFVYKDRKSAILAQKNFQGEVWECEYVPFKGRLRQTKYGPLAGWAGKDLGVLLERLPKTARLASRVRLTKKVS